MNTLDTISTGGIVPANADGSDPLEGLDPRKIENAFWNRAVHDNTHVLQGSTDYDLAEHFAARVEEKLVYDPADDLWYVWRSPMYRRARAGGAVAFLQTTAQENISRVGRDDRAADFVARAGKLKSLSKATAVLKTMGNLKNIAVPGDSWDKDPWLLGTPNAVVDLRTGFPVEVEDYTMVRRHTAIPYVGAEHGRVTIPEKFIAATRMILPDEEVWRYVMRAIGYAMTGETGEQVWFFFHGTGGNGKTFLAETLRRILGPAESDGYAYSGKEDTFTTGKVKNPINYGSAMNAMRGARLVIVPEISHGELDTDLMKKITGGEPVTYRAPYGRVDVTYTPSAHLIMYGNSRPTITDSSHGNWRRLLEVPFTVRVEDVVKPIKNYWLELIEEEGPAIQRMLIMSAAMYYKEGLLPVPRAIVEATQDYRDSSDPFAMWLKERAELTPRASAKASSLFNSYDWWCSENKAPAMGSKTFYDRIATLEGVTKRAMADGNHYVGIVLRSAE